MANRRREPVTYRPFRTEPVLAEGLLAVARPGGEFLDRVAAGMFRLAAEAGAVASADAARRGNLDGQQAALAGRARTDVVGGASPGAPEGGGKALTGTRAEKAAQAKAYFVQKHGLSDVAAAGLIGNFAQESGFDTRAVNPGDGVDGSDSIGMAQWNGARARAFRAFAAKAGKPTDDFEVQLDFVVHELNTTEATAGNRLRQARTVEEATAAAIGYERPQGWTPANPAGGHGWANRLAAARSVYGAPVAAAPASLPAPPGQNVMPLGPGAQPAAAAPAATQRPPDMAGAGVTVQSGGSFRPRAGNSTYDRAYNAAGVRTYVQQLETEMRETTQQLFELHRDDPVALEKALEANRRDMAARHVFPEIQADFEIGYGAMASRLGAQARDNLARKVEEQDRVAFYERTGALETDQQKRLAAFDPASGDAADAIASSQAAIDDHYDSAVQRGILSPEAAARAKTESRRGSALSYYGKQADALDADGVRSMREEMKADFAAGELAGLDGEGYQQLSRSLEKLETVKRSEAERATQAFRVRGDQMVARIAAGFEIEPADMAELQLDSGRTPEGRAALDETLAKINQARAVRDMSLREADGFVRDLRKSIGETPTDSQLRQLASAEGLLDQKRKAIATDQLAYAEAQGIVPETPHLTEAAGADDMVTIMQSRVLMAPKAAQELGVPPRFLKAGEAAAIGALVRSDPEKGAAVAGAIVRGAGGRVAEILAEFGDDAPVVAEAGAILALDGSPQAAEDVIRGYGKSADGKALKAMKPADSRAGFRTVAGGALALAPKDAARIERAAGAIARKRIADEGIDADSDEAREIHRRAVHEAAGGVFDRGVQWGGFAPYGGSIFGGGDTVLVPNRIRADMFEDVIGALTDEDLATLKVKPRAGVASFWSGKDRLPPALTLKRARPVAVSGGHAFAMGDPAGDDPQFVQGDDGEVFVLDVMSLRSRLETRVPGAFR